MTAPEPPRHPLNPRALHAFVVALVAALVGVAVYGLIRLAQSITGLR